MQSGSTLWAYCSGGTHAAPTQGAATGTVTLAATSANASSSWPLPVGSSWTTHYLVDDGYSSIASVDFDIR